MPGPETLREFDLLADEVKRVGAEVSEVRDYIQTEATRLDARLDEHSKERSHDRQEFAEVKTTLALMMQSLDGIKDLGKTIRNAVVTTGVALIIGGVIFLLTHSDSIAKGHGPWPGAEAHAPAEASPPAPQCSR